MLMVAALAQEATIVVLGGRRVVEAELGVLCKCSANGVLRQSTFPLAGPPHNCHMQETISHCTDYILTTKFTSNCHNSFSEVHNNYRMLISDNYLIFWATYFFYSIIKLKNLKLTDNNAVQYQKTNTCTIDKLQYLQD